MRDRDDAKLRRPVDATPDPARPPGRATLDDPANAEPSASVTRGPRQQFHTTQPGALYDDDGRAIASVGVVPAHCAIDVHAGSIRRLRLHGEARAVECVYVVDDRGRSGWMPTSVLPSVVAREQRGGARRFGIERDDGLPKKKRRLIASSPDGAPDLDADGWELDAYDAFVTDEIEPFDGLVFGYVESETGERIYGWIDASLLGAEL